MPIEKVQSEKYNNEKSRFLFVRKIIYGLGALPVNLWFMPIMITQNFYLMSIVQLSPYIVALVLNLGHLWDAINDPIIGILLNRTRTRYGAIKPWMIICSFLCGVTFVLNFYIPSVLVTFWQTFAYYLVMFICFRFFVSGYMLPYFALVMSISKTDKERQSYILYQTLFLFIGNAMGTTIFTNVFSIDPSKLYSAPSNASNASNAANASSSSGATSVYTFENEKIRFTHAAIIVTSLAIFLGWTCAFGSKEINKQNSEIIEKQTSESFKKFLIRLKSVLFFRKYVMFTLINGLALLGNGIVYSTLYFYLSYVVKRSPTTSAKLLTVLAFSTIPIAIFAYYLNQKLKPKIVFFIGVLSNVPSALIFFFLPEDAHDGFIYLNMVVNAFPLAIVFFVVAAILPRIIEYYAKNRSKDGARNDALFFSFYIICTKLSNSIAPVIVNAVLAKNGYDSKNGYNQPDSVGTALRYIFLASQLVFPLICCILLIFFKIPDETNNLESSKEQELKLYKTDDFENDSKENNLNENEKIT